MLSPGGISQAERRGWGSCGTAFEKVSGEQAVPLAVAAPSKELVLGTSPPDSSQDLVSRKQVKPDVLR